MARELQRDELLSRKKERIRREADDMVGYIRLKLHWFDLLWISSTTCTTNPQQIEPMDLEPNDALNCGSVLTALSRCT